MVRTAIPGGVVFSPGASPVVGFVATLHVGLALVRHHRRHDTALISPVLLISFAFALAPWIFSTPAGLAFGLGVHLLWFVACERMLAPGLAPASARSGMHPVAIAAPPASAPRREVTMAQPPAASSAPPRPKGFVRTPVIATFDETPSIKTFRMVRPDGFDFIAGQFVAIRIRVDGQEHVRCYSISSPPDVRGYLEISVKRQGLVSSALHATARPGALLSVKAPAGAFRYPAGDDRPILLLAGGVGITPLISMLRHAVTTEPMRPIALIYSVHSEADLAFRDDLYAIARRHPQVRLWFAASDASRPSMYRGRIDEELLRTVVPEIAQWIAYICGPSAMIDGLRDLLARLGVPKPQIRFEVFQAAIAATRRDDEAEPDGHGAGSAQPSSAASFNMLCARAGKRVAVSAEQSILEAAESAGVDVPSLCRSGVCGTCRIQVTEGDVQCRSTMLADDERRAGYVLACVTTVASDCTVQV